MVPVQKPLDQCVQWPLNSSFADATAVFDVNVVVPCRWVKDLIDPDAREMALLELSKQREKFPELAPYLWNSFGTMAVLLQVCSPPTHVLTLRSNTFALSGADSPCSAGDHNDLSAASSAGAEHANVEPGLQCISFVSVCGVTF